MPPPDVILSDEVRTGSWQLNKEHFIFKIWSKKCPDSRPSVDLISLVKVKRQRSGDDGDCCVQMKSYE